MNQYAVVRDEYQKWLASGGTPDVSLEQFAKYQDAQDGTNSRTVAYSDGWVKKVNAGIDALFAPLAEPAGALGEMAGAAVGMPEVGRNVGESLPRSAAEFMVPVGAAASVTGKVAPWLMRGAEAAGAFSGFARGYSDTDNAMVGLISAASPTLLHGAASKVVGSYADKVAKRYAAELVAGSTEKAGARAASELVKEEALRQGTYLAGGELLNAAQAGVDPNQEYDPFTKEYLFSQVLGQAATLPADLVTLGRGMTRPDRLPSVASQAKGEALAMETARQQRAKEVAEENLRKATEEARAAVGVPAQESVKVDDAIRAQRQEATRFNEQVQSTSPLTPRVWNEALPAVEEATGKRQAKPKAGSKTKEQAFADEIEAMLSKATPAESLAPKTATPKPVAPQYKVPDVSSDLPTKPNGTPSAVNESSFLGEVAPPVKPSAVDAEMQGTTPTGQTVEVPVDAVPDVAMAKSAPSTVEGQMPAEVARVAEDAVTVGMEKAARQGDLSVDEVQKMEVPSSLPGLVQEVVQAKRVEAVMAQSVDEVAVNQQGMLTKDWAKMVEATQLGKGAMVNSEFVALLLRGHENKVIQVGNPQELVGFAHEKVQSELETARALAERKIAEAVDMATKEAATRVKRRTRNVPEGGYKKVAEKQAQAAQAEANMLERFAAVKQGDAKMGQWIDTAMAGLNREFGGEFAVASAFGDYMTAKPEVLSQPAEEAAATFRQLVRDGAIKLQRTVKYTKATDKTKAAKPAAMDKVASESDVADVEESTSATARKPESVAVIGPKGAGIVHSWAAWADEVNQNIKYPEGYVPSDAMIEARKAFDKIPTTTQFDRFVKTHIGDVIRAKGGDEYSMRYLLREYEMAFPDKKVDGVMRILNQAFDAKTGAPKNKVVIEMLNAYTAERLRGRAELRDGPVDLQTQQPEGPVAGKEADVLMPTNKAGTKAEVVFNASAYDETTLSKAFYSHFRNQGYAPEVSTWLAETAGTHYKLFKQLAPDVFVVPSLQTLATYGSSQHGWYLSPSAAKNPGSQAYEKAIIALFFGEKLTNEQQRGAAAFAKQLAASHEMAHALVARAKEFVKSKNAHTVLLGKSVLNMLQYVEGLSAAEKYSVQSRILQHLLPEELRAGDAKTAQGNRVLDGMLNYTSNGKGAPEETTVHILAMLMTSEVSSRRAGLVHTGMFSEVKPEHGPGTDRFGFLPSEIVLAQHGIYKSYASMWEGIKANVTDAEAKVVDNALRTVRGWIGQTQLALADAELQAALINTKYSPEEAPLAAIARGTTIAEAQVRHGKYVNGRLKYLLPDEPTASTLVTSEIKGAMGGLARMMFGGTNERGQVELSKFTQLFTPSIQKYGYWHQEGVAAARDAQTLMHQAGTLPTVYSDKLFGPLLVEGEKGLKEFDKRASLIAHADLPKDKLQMVHKAVDAIRLMTNKTDGLAVRYDDPSVAKSVDAEILKLPSELQGYIKPMMDELYGLMQRGAAFKVEQAVEQSSLRLALALRAARPGDSSKDLEVAARAATEMLRAAKQMDPNVDGAEVLMQAKFGPEDAKYMSSFLTPLLERADQLKAYFDSRPGYLPEVRYGSHMVEWTDKATGERKSLGAKGQVEADAMTERLKREGHLNVSNYDKYARFGQYTEQVRTANAVQFARMEAEAHRKSMEALRNSGKYSDDQIESLDRMLSPGGAVLRDITARGLEAQMQDRKFVGGRDELDTIKAALHATETLARAGARMQLRMRAALLADDPQVRNAPQFKADFENTFETLMQPDSRTAQGIRTGLTAFYMGFNLSSAVVESLQSIQTLLPGLMRSGSTTQETFKHYQDALSTLIKLRKPEYLKSMLQSTDRKQQLFGQLYKQAMADGTLSVTHLSESMGTQDRDAVMARRFGLDKLDNTTKVELGKNALAQFAHTTMKLHGTLADANMRLAFLSFLEQGYAQGISGQALYNHAAIRTREAMGGGGKTNRPGAVGLTQDRTWRGVASVGLALSQYGLATTSHFFRDAIRSHKDPNARRAFAAQLITGVSLSGVLGLPFAGALVALLEKYAGIDAKTAIATAMQDMDKEDEGFGRFASDSMLHGLANRIAGIDLSSRTGQSTLLGFNPYSGYDIANAMGPVPGLVRNMFEGSVKFARGDFGSGIKQILPSALKGPVTTLADEVTLADGFQFRDNNNKLLIDPTGWEVAAYMGGFQPLRLANLKEQQHSIAVQQQIKADRDRREYATFAQEWLNPEGDTKALLDYLRQRQREEPSFNPKAFLRNASEHALEMALPKDVMQTSAGSKAAQLHGIQNARRSEVAALQMRDALLRKLGYPFGTQRPNNAQLTRARAIDAVIAKTGVSRQEAAKYVDGVMSQ